MQRGSPVVLLFCPVAPTRRRKAKEDEADGVSFTEFRVSSAQSVPPNSSDSIRDP